MAVINGVRVTGSIVPSDTADVYPTHISLYGKGGHSEVASSSVRDAIPAERRSEGMTVWVVADNKCYVLQGGISNGNWVAFGLTPSSNGTGSTVISSSAANTFKSLKVASQLTISADSNEITVGLNTSGITAGSFTAPNITVDTYGRITSATSQTFIATAAVAAQTMSTDSGVYTTDNSNATTTRDSFVTANTGNAIVSYSGGTLLTRRFMGVGGINISTIDADMIFDGSSLTPLNSPETILTSDYTVAANNSTHTLLANAALTITIPDGLPNGFRVSVLNIGSGSVIINGSGATDITLTAGQFCNVIVNNSKVRTTPVITTTLIST